MILILLLLIIQSYCGVRNASLRQTADYMGARFIPPEYSAKADATTLANIVQHMWQKGFNNFNYFFEHLNIN